MFIFFYERGFKIWGEEVLFRKGMKEIIKVWFLKFEYVLGYKEIYFIFRI